MSHQKFLLPKDTTGRPVLLLRGEPALCSLLCHFAVPMCSSQDKKQFVHCLRCTGNVLGGTSPKPVHATEHRSAWLEILYPAQLQPLMHEYRSQLHLHIRGFTKYSSHYLGNNCINPVFERLWAC